MVSAKDHETRPNTNGRDHDKVRLARPTRWRGCKQAMKSIANNSLRRRPVHVATHLDLRVGVMQCVMDGCVGRWVGGWFGAYERVGVGAWWVHWPSVQAYVLLLQHVHLY